MSPYSDVSSTEVIGHAVSGTDGNILALDEAVADMLQRPRRELIGASYLTITHRHDHARNQNAIDNLREDRSRMYIRKRYVKADCSTIWVGLNVSHLHEPSGSAAFVATLHRIAPITEGGNPSLNWRAVREHIKAIHLRKQMLGENLFADHAWLILLEVYLAEAEGRCVGIDALSDAAGVSLRTTRRCLDILVKRHLIELIGGDDGVPQLSHIALSQVEDILQNGTDGNVAQF